MITVFSMGSLALNIITLSIAVVLFALIDVFFVLVTRRIVPLVLQIVFEIISIVSFIFCLDYLMFISVSLLVVVLFLSFFMNVGGFRPFLTAGQKIDTFKDFFSKRKKEVLSVKVYDRDRVLDELTEAVTSLSKKSTGAIITILMKDNIFEMESEFPIIKQKGVSLDCRVDAELIESIFYLGTRLHDGALVIKDDRIIAGAVFYESTKRPLKGKYGARHQAAMGISENSDAITIVVSEENSRISICHDTIMDTVPVDSFRATLEKFLIFGDKK